MYTAPKQKVVTIHKTACDKSNVYATINVESARKASKNLTDAGRLLWMYLAMNADGYTFALSNTAVTEQWNIERKRYNKAVNELVEKGYLVCRGGKNYDFIECPDASIVLKEDISMSQNGTMNSPIQDIHCPKMGHSIAQNGTFIVPKRDIQLSQNGTRNTINTTIDNTEYNIRDNESTDSQPHKSSENVSQYEYDDDYGFGESVPSKRDEGDTMKRSPEYWEAYRKWQKSFNMPAEKNVIRISA